MASGNETATFGINLSGNAADAANEAASALEVLRQRIAAGQGALKEMSGNLRNLRGSTDEVRRAKDELKAKLDSEREAVSKATLELLKQSKAQDKGGDSSKKLATESSKLTDKLKAQTVERKKLDDKLKSDATKLAADKAKALGAAVSAAGGPVADLKSKLGMLKDIAGEGGAGGAMSFLALGAAGAAAAVAALVVGIAAGVVALAKFVLKGADAARSVGLLREASMAGNAQWGKNFGEQVDALARKVPTSKAEIDKLGISLAKSRIGGQVWVDTLNAVTQASAALGDDAGNALKGFIERGKQFNRFQLNPLEMVGTGVDFKDVAEALATQMHVGVKEATAALYEGRVKLGDGAAALRAAVEKKFSGINLRQMLSFDNLVKKLGESLDELTKGIDLEPMLKGAKELFKTFSLTTESGQALKQIVEVFGKGLVSAFVELAPLAKKFVYGLIIGAQEIVIGYLQVRNSLKKAFGDSEILKNVDALSIALTAGKIAAYGIGAAVLMTAGFVAVAAAPFVLVGLAIYGMIQQVSDAIDLLGDIKDAFAELGGKMIDGLLNSLVNGTARIKDAVVNLAEGAKNSFKETLGIHSPSKVFEEYGKNTTKGFAQGVEGSSGVADAAVSGMVSTPSGSGAGAAPVTVNLTINVSGGDGQQAAAALSSESLLEQITKAVVDAIHGAGVPVPG